MNRYKTLFAGGPVIDQDSETDGNGSGGAEDYRDNISAHMTNKAEDSIELM